MPWCPECGEEYRDGFTVCADCGSALADELPDMDDDCEDDEDSGYGYSEIDAIMDGYDAEKAGDALPQLVCVNCDRSFDMDYPKCPYCKTPVWEDEL